MNNNLKLLGLGVVCGVFVHYLVARTKKVEQTLIARAASVPSLMEIGDNHWYRNAVDDLKCGRRSYVEAARGRQAHPMSLLNYWAVQRATGIEDKHERALYWAAYYCAVHTVPTASSGRLSTRCLELGRMPRRIEGVQKYFFQRWVSTGSI
jgi:hypothetical protein